MDSYRWSLQFNQVQHRAIECGWAIERCCARNNHKWRFHQCILPSIASTSTVHDSCVRDKYGFWTRTCCPAVVRGQNWTKASDWIAIQVHVSQNYRCLPRSLLIGKWIFNYYTVFMLFHKIVDVDLMWELARSIEYRNIYVKTIWLCLFHSMRSRIAEQPPLRPSKPIKTHFNIRLVDFTTDDKESKQNAFKHWKYEMA